MKFAIITDIHGNAPALQAVLNEVDERNDIDHIYCLGDMIAIGPDTNEVLDLLFSRHDVSMISGNHDEAVLAIIKGEPHPLSHPHVKEHHEWIANGIDVKFIHKLHGLPRFIRKDILGRSVFFTHYHVDANKMDAHISEDPYARIVLPSLENMEELFGPQDARLNLFWSSSPGSLF